MNHRITCLLSALLVACTRSPAALLLAARDAGEPHETTDAAIRDADAPEDAFRLSYSATLAPGAELVSVEQSVTLPADLWIDAWSAQLRYVHHIGVLVTLPNETAARLVFTALTPNFAQHIPLEGGALHLRGGSKVSFNVHRLNPTTAPVTATAEVALHLAAEHSTEVWTAYVDTIHIAAPPLTQTRVSYWCDVPAAVRILSLEGHAHAHNVLETVSLDGVERYRATDWAEPPTVYLPAPTPAKRIDWSCTIDNTTSSQLVYGQTLDRNEMCQAYMLVTGLDWSCIR